MNETKHIFGFPINKVISIICRVDHLSRRSGVASINSFDRVSFRSSVFRSKVMYPSADVSMTSDQKSKDAHEPHHEHGHHEHVHKPKGCCGKLCQSRWCLLLIIAAVLVTVAVVVPVVLLTKSARDRLLSSSHQEMGEISREASSTPPPTPGGKFAPDLKWWQKAIVYQIYPRSYQDSNGDGFGDIQGIISRLDHLEYINVQAVWLSPFYPSPDKDFGYDITDFKAVDTRFGTLHDFDDFLNKAHQLGLRVILDFVVGYTSSDHEWFKLSANRTSPYQNYYVWSDGKTLDNGTKVPPNNWVSQFGFSAWEWNSQREQFVYHAFTPQQPQLNYRDPGVVQQMQDVLRFWLERGVDGFRVDALDCMMVYHDLDTDQAPSNIAGTLPWQPNYWVNNLTKNQPEAGDVIRGWRKVLNSYVDDSKDDDSKFMVVEQYQPPEERNKYYGYGADMPFNFDLVIHVQSGCNAICLRDAIKNEYDFLPKDRWANFVLSNHDNHRATARKGVMYQDAMHVLLLTLRGTPTTYYGEEIAMEEISLTFAQTVDPQGINAGPTLYKGWSRDPERAPMQWNTSANAGFSTNSHTWLPVNTDYTTINVQTEKSSVNTTTLHVYRDLALLRQEPSLQYGLFTFADVTPDILSYLRSAEDHPEYLVIINFGNSSATRDFSGPPVNRGQGQVKVVSSKAANEGRFAKDGGVSLKSIQLEPGDGLVIQLNE